VGRHSRRFCSNIVLSSSSCLILALVRKRYAEGNERRRKIKIKVSLL
jgi:hypothetical protein